jgi:hypothetical protein
LKRNKFEKITDWEHFRQYAIRWEEVTHTYNQTLKLVDWSAPAEKWAHKSCKGLFFKDLFLQSQQCIPTPTPESEPIPSSLVQDDREEFPEGNIRQSTRKQFTYKSSWQEVEKNKCIICNEDKRAKGRLIPVQTIRITAKAEETLKEYATLHLKNRNVKYMEGANMILLTLAAKYILAADVAYHKRLCYEPFRSPAWKRDSNKSNITVTSEEDNALEEICQLVLIHIINRHEIYTMAQLKSAFDEIQCEKGLSSSRTTDLKEKLQQTFGTHLNFHRATQSSARCSEFVFPEGVEFTANCVQSSLLGGGISKYVSLKNAAKTIHTSIKDTREDRPWPPTPQDILEAEAYINTDLYNELSWIVDPHARLDKEGRVQLSKIKATKIHQICQDIQALLPKSQPSLDQVLLSLTMHRKTGSSGVVDTIHGLGYGISYTETVFIEDKWAEWSERQHSDIPSNIAKGIQTTHIADNIDWKNKQLSGTHETHNTNAILVQHNIPGPANNDARQKAQVSVTPEYDFRREDHHSFIAKLAELPQYSGKKAGPESIAYKQDSSQKECEKSKLETLAWVKCRRGKDDPSNQIVPAWSAFRQLTTKDCPPRVNVGYLPAITAPPTDIKVILSIMNRTMQYMTELELDFIFLEVDQAIYNKVLQVLFKFKEEGSTCFDKMIVRMGGFHIIMCLMKTIYSRFSGSGIIELLSEVGVGAEGTIKAGLNGSNVKQGIRYYKLLFEALLRTKLDFMESHDPQPTRLNMPQLHTDSIASLEVEDTSTCHNFMGMHEHDDIETQLITPSVHDQPEDTNFHEPLLEFVNMSLNEENELEDNISEPDTETGGDLSLEAALSSLQAEQTPEKLEKVVNHPEMKLTPPMIGGMATWMDSYIEMVDLLLNIIHFQRTGNWEGFLEAIDEFLPWCFGLNRQNYARNMSYFYVDMRDLKTRNPDAYQYLHDGGFSGSLSGEKHTKIPMDQIIEMTINRFSKETGGLSGKTENVGASERWMRINHYLAALKQHLEDKVKKVTIYKHVELGTKRMQKDEAAVQRIVAGLHHGSPIFGLQLSHS